MKLRQFFGWLFSLCLALASNAGQLQASYPRLFPDLVLRFPVGDVGATNPLQNTEGPKSLAAGDFNGDGRADIVTGNLDGSISVLLGAEKGLQDQMLVPATGILSNSSIRSIVVADFNRDGKMDAAVADIARGGVIILLGTGDGGLKAHERIVIGPARALAVADFNEDGNPDLLAGSSPADEDRKVPYAEAGTNRFLCILPGKGDGTFQPPQYLFSPGVAAYFYKVVAADMNQDGHEDVVALDFSVWQVETNKNVTQKRLLAFYNDGKGGFTTNNPQLTLASTGQGPRAFCVAYVDERLADGGKPPPGATLDMVVANRDSSTLDIFLNRGNGEYSNPVTLRVGCSTRDVAAGDLDGDGYTDLVVVDRDKNLISILRGQGNGQFSEVITELPTGVSPRQIVLADINGDGVLDAAVNNRVSEDISIFLGISGLAGFLMPGSYYPAGFSPISVVTGDFNGDGYADVATANLRSHDVRVRLNQKDGSFGPEAIYTVNFEPVCLAIGDLNHDGQPDLVVSCLGAGPQPVPGIHGSLVTLLGRGDGAFARPAEIPPGNSGLLFTPYWLRLGDLSGDGVLDAVVGGANGSLLVFRGKGDGTFETGQAIGVKADGRPLGLALGDFDQDGRLDVATSRGKIIFNDGQFFSGTNLFTDNGLWLGRMATFITTNETGFFQAWAVEAEDLDADGKLDLLVALTFRRPDPIGIFYGKGDGTFTEPTIYEGPDVGAVALAGKDMDGDGIKDLVIGNRCAATVIIMKGLGNRKFEIREIIRSYSVEGLSVCDLNNDGKPDIVGVGMGLWPIINGSTTSFVEPKTAQWGNAPERWGLYINEIMALNQLYYNERETSPDWVEIYNHSTFTQNLSGWSMMQITRDGETKRWDFPANTIGPRQHQVVICKKKSSELFAPFELSAEGETIVLLRPGGIEEDRVSFPALPSDVSYARYLDGARFFCLNPSPTMGTPNRPPANLRPSAARKDPYVSPGGRALALTARMFDDVAIAFAAVGYRVSGSTQKTFTEIPLNDDGKNGDKLAGDGYYGVFLPSLPPGATIEYYLRAVDVDGEVATSPDNPDDPTQLHRITSPQAGSAIRLNELVADNQTGLQDEIGLCQDWIELVNTGTDRASLDGLALTKDFFNPQSAWYFPTNTWLEPGGYLIVFCDEQPASGSLHTNFKLLRDGDRVFLVQTNHWTIIDSLSFGPLPRDTSFGLLNHGFEAQWLAWPTPRAANLGFAAHAQSPQSPSGIGKVGVRVVPSGIIGTSFFGLRWQANPVANSRVEWSEDMTHWSPAEYQPDHLGEGLFQWFDIVASVQHRFYRVIQAP